MYTFQETSAFADSRSVSWGVVDIYNNLLYAIAGRAGEVKSGQQYENLINIKIIGPLGMSQASCGTQIYPSSSQTNYALPYHLKNGTLEVGDSRIYQ